MHYYHFMLGLFIFWLYRAVLSFRGGLTWGTEQLLLIALGLGILLLFGLIRAAERKHSPA